MTPPTLLFIVNSNYFGISIKDVPTPHMLDRAAMCSFLSIEFYRLLIRGKVSC